MSSTDFCQRTVSYLDCPQYLVIDIKGINQWVENFESRAFYDLNLCELLELLFESFKDQSQAMLMMDHSLFEYYGGSCYPDEINTYDQGIIAECRKIGIRLYKYLCQLGCFIHGRLYYKYFRKMNDESFLIWRLTDEDVIKP